MESSYGLAPGAGREPPRQGDGQELARSMERVMDRARDVLQDQARLWRLEATETAQHVSRGAAGLLAAAAFGALAWIAAMMALHQLLLAWLAPALSLLLVALINGAIAVAALLGGRRALQRDRASDPGAQRP